MAQAALEILQSAPRRRARSPHTGNASDGKGRAAGQPRRAGRGLGVRRVDIARTGDSALVLAGFRRWAAEAAGELEGDFCVRYLATPPTG